MIASIEASDSKPIARARFDSSRTGQVATIFWMRGSISHLMRV